MVTFFTHIGRPHKSRVVDWVPSPRLHKCGFVKKVTMSTRLSAIVLEHISVRVRAELKYGKWWNVGKCVDYKTINIFLELITREHNFLHSCLCVCRYPAGNFRGLCLLFSPSSPFFLSLSQLSLLPLQPSWKMLAWIPRLLISLLVQLVKRWAGLGHSCLAAYLILYYY